MAPVKQGCSARCPHRRTFTSAWPISAFAKAGWEVHCETDGRFWSFFSSVEGLYIALNSTETLGRSMDVSFLIGPVDIVEIAQELK